MIVARFVTYDPPARSRGLREEPVYEILASDRLGFKPGQTVRGDELLKARVNLPASPTYRTWLSLLWEQRRKSEKAVA